MSEDMGSVGQLSAGISETTISGMYYLKGGVHQSAMEHWNRLHLFFPMPKPCDWH